MQARLIKADVFEVEGLGIDAAFGRSDPASHFRAFEDTVHQTVHEGAVGGGWQPFVLTRRELFAVDRHAFEIRRDVGPTSDRAAETRAGQLHAL